MNICFNINPDVLGPLSLKNISLYIIFFCIITQYITQKSHDRESYGKIYLFVFLYLIYSLVIFIYNHLSLSNLNLFDSLYSLKSSFDPFIILILLIYMYLDNKSTQIAFNLSLFLFLILNSITVFDSLGLVNINHIGFDEVYGRTSGAFGESNVYASYIALFLPLTVSFLMNSKNIYYMIFMYLNIFFGVYALVLTGSRGGFLSAIISFIVFFVLTMKNVHATKKIANVYVVALLFLSVFIVFKTTPALTVDGINNNIISRYGTSDLNDYSSGRIDLWKKGLNIFLDNPFFGAQESFSEIVGSNTHNTYLEILVSRGFVGLFLFISIFYYIFKNIYNKYLEDVSSVILPSYIAGFCSFIVSMFFLNMFSAYYFFFIYSALAIKIK